MSLLEPTAHLLGPIIGLNMWTFAMEGWMYYRRLSWFMGTKQNVSSSTTKAQFDAMQPPEVRWKADNYNHLFEQPTQFYAVAGVLALMGARGKVDVGLAWTYVALRIVHSFVQSCGNNVPVRFQLYIVNSTLLLGMTVRAGLMVIDHLMK